MRADNLRQSHCRPAGLAVRWRRLVVIVLSLSLCIAGCNDPPLAPSPLVPSRITDLRAETTADSTGGLTIHLRWTVPAIAPGSAPARVYEVRASTQSLVGDQWLAVAPQLLPATHAAGEQETTTFRGFQRGRQYSFVVRSMSSQGAWSSWSNIAVSPGNTPPAAAFTLDPDSTCVGTPIDVDASPSTDLDDESSLLEVRWDWEDDGIWDTEWSRVKTTSHRYLSRNVYTIRLEVRDRDGGTAQITHRVTCNVVRIVRAFRLVGHLEEVYNCPVPYPPPCYPSPVERKETTDALGAAHMHLGWTDQTSTVGVDTLRFDGTIRLGIQWPSHSNWVNYDVTFEACAPVAYQIAGHADCGGDYLRLSDAHSVFYDLAPCGIEPRDFTAAGVLPPGTYRLEASVATDDESRMTFEMVLGAATSAEAAHSPAMHLEVARSDAPFASPWQRMHADERPRLDPVPTP